MRIRVTLKDPDTLYDAVVDAFKRLEQPEGVEAQEWADIRCERVKMAAHTISSQWMPYGEYLYVEFDLDAKTATVLPAKDFK